MAEVYSPMMSDSSNNFDIDKLTNDIFSILENKFLFDSKQTNSKLPVEELVETLKANKHDVGKVRVLSIDGVGSTDGILAAKSLCHLESILINITKNSDARVADYFDVASGSGIGGILIALLFTRGKDGRPLLKANEALQFLVKNRKRLNNSGNSSGWMFGKMFRSSLKTEKIFRKIFGECTLKDTLKPVLIPCFDLKTRATFLFSRADGLENDGYDFKMREICVATSSDLTVNGGFEMKSVDKKTKILAVDGGLAMNNPTAAAITHVLNNKQEFPYCDSVEDLLVVSLGNGESYSGDRNLSISAAGFLKIAGEGASDTVDQAVSMAFGEFRTENYVRIQGNNGMTNPQRTPIRNPNTVSMDGRKLLEVSEAMLKQKNVESVLFRGKKLVATTNLQKLDEFAGVLVKEHERRKSSIFATVMFKHASPRSSSATVSTDFSW
ncbi:hypothetical protein MKX01_001367 [Papaver californicum]|nr:hypothetical protein MKX01_001367 [Papaver californicum]